MIDMKNIDKLRTKNIDELAEWLDKYSNFEESPWINQFNKKYCEKCESIKGRYEDCDRELDFSWCELYDKCRFFPDMNSTPDTKQMIKMWLESEIDG